MKILRFPRSPCTPSLKKHIIIQYHLWGCRWSLLYLSLPHFGRPWFELPSPKGGKDFCHAVSEMFLVVSVLNSCMGISMVHGRQSMFSPWIYEDILIDLQCEDMRTNVPGNKLSLIQGYELFYPDSLEMFNYETIKTINGWLLLQWKWVYVGCFQDVETWTDMSSCR